MPEACPKCHSEDWKSAKLVVLEGTTTSSGKLSGDIVEKGAFSGGLREFLLSDRWFSFESPIDANFSSAMMTGLVDEVKVLLVAEGSKRPMPERPEYPSVPERPNEPKKLQRDQGKFLAIAPSEKTKPQPPVAPKDFITELGEFERRSRWQNFKDCSFKSFVFGAIFLSAWSYFFPESMTSLKNFFAAILDILPEDHPAVVSRSFSLDLPYISDWLREQEFSEKTVRRISFLAILGSYLVLRLPIDLIKAGGVEKKREAKHQAALAKAKAKQEEEQEKYDVALSAYDQALASWAADMEQFRKEVSEYQTELAVYQSRLQDAEARYRDMLSDYEAEAVQVNAFRAELWDRSRVCTRCGNVYLGERFLLAQEPLRPLHRA